MKMLASWSLFNDTSLKYLIFACLMLIFELKLVVPFVMILGKPLSVSRFLNFCFVFQKSCASKSLSILDSLFHSGLCASDNRIMACVWISFCVRVFFPKCHF